MNGKSKTILLAASLLVIQICGCKAQCHRAEGTSKAPEVEQPLKTKSVTVPEGFASDVYQANKGEVGKAEQFTAGPEEPANETVPEKIPDEKE